MYIKYFLIHCLNVSKKKKKIKVPEMFLFYSLVTFNIISYKKYGIKHYGDMFETFAEGPSGCFKFPMRCYFHITEIILCTATRERERRWIFQSETRTTYAE